MATLLQPRSIFPIFKLRQPAVKKLLLTYESKIKERLITTEIVTLQWEVKPKNNPWLEIAGKYAADPDFDRMLFHIETERNLDALEEYSSEEHTQD